MINIAVLIPNYNGAGFIRATVDEFQKSFSGLEIIVVDDVSTDNSVSILGESDITLLVRSANGGFAAAVNTGLRYVVTHGIDFVLVANSDVGMTPFIADRILSVINNLSLQEPGVILGFQEEDDHYKESRNGDKISGFFFGLDSRIIQKVGYLDESYIMYGEEQDYFKRVELAEFKIQQTNIVIPHEGEKSAVGSLKNSWFAIRNALKLEVKFFSLKNLVRTFCVLFLVINRLYRPAPNHSIHRLLRPGVFMGNIFLMSAVIWNVVMLPKTLIEKKNEYK